jgi:hypothetical protein
VLKGKVTTRLVMEVVTMLLMLGLVLLGTFADNPDITTACVTTASLVVSLTVFLMAFDYIRLQHIASTMLGSDYLGESSLSEHIAGFANRSMGQPIVASGGADDADDVIDFQPATEEETATD